ERIFRLPDERTASRRLSGLHVPALENIAAQRRTLGAACRHWADAAVDLDVLVWRCARQIHGCDLFGRAIAVAAGMRGAGRAAAASVAAARRIRAPRAAMAAIAP